MVADSDPAPRGEERKCFAPATWEPSVRVNDTRERDGTSQYRPVLAVAPGGRLDIAYYDRSGDARGNVMNEVSLQSSTDGGKAFGPSVRLSDRAFDSRIGFGSERGMPDLGSRIGLLSDRARAIAVWADTRAGTEASGKQDLGAAVVAFSEREQPSIAQHRTLRIAGIGALVAGVALLVAALLSRRRAGRSGPAPPPETDDVEDPHRAAVTTPQD